MKIPWLGSFVFSLFLLVLLGYFVLEAAAYSPRARIVPWFVGIPTFLLQLIVTLAHQFPKLLHGFDVDVIALARNHHPSSATGERPPSDDRARRRVELAKLVMIGVWMGASFIALYLLGFLPMLFGVVFLFLWFSGGIPWWRSFLIAIAFTGGVWAIFHGMRLTLFEGSLRGAYIPPFF
jgi:hypothetical protein